MATNYSKGQEQGFIGKTSSTPGADTAPRPSRKSPKSKAPTETETTEQPPAETEGGEDTA